MAYHPFSETESKAPAELAVCIVFLVLTYLAVGARCYVRACIIKSFGWDDGLMVVALVRWNALAFSTRPTNASFRSSLMYGLFQSLSSRISMEEVHTPVLSEPRCT